MTEKVIKKDEMTSKYNVTFSLQRIGDYVHTFILKGTTNQAHTNIDQIFESYALYGKIENSTRPVYDYYEGMTLAVNNTLARATGWLPVSTFETPCVGSFVIPLLLQETVNPTRSFLPLLIACGEGRIHQLICEGIESKEIAESLLLEMDYGYLDHNGRCQMAHEMNQINQYCGYISNYCTFRTTIQTTMDGTGKIRYPIEPKTQEFLKKSSEVNPILSVKIIEDGKHHFDQTANVVGFLLRPSIQGIVKKVSICLNGLETLVWSESDHEINWKKVGLTNPQDGTILMPLSRNMWNDLLKASTIDVSRVDVMEFEFCTNGSREFDIEITALGHTIRMSKGHHVSFPY